MTPGNDCSAGLKEQEDTFFTLRDGKYEETDKNILLCKKIGIEMARQRNRREGTCCERPGVMFEDIGGRCVFFSLSITCLLICFVVYELNATWQPVAVLPLCVTVWEFCCVGGSPRSAPGRSRGRQLVYYGPH